MQGKKRYTNATFTKRVDHEAGRRRTPRAGKGPEVCEDCGAVYADKRWTLAGAKRGDEKHSEWRPPRMTVCPACKQVRAGVPGGFVHLSGAFFVGLRAPGKSRKSARTAARSTPTSAGRSPAPSAGTRNTPSGDRRG